MKINQTYEWDPVLTPKMEAYLDARLNGDFLEIRLNRNDITILLDAQCIPSLIKILQRMDKRL